jgi:general secretion pathway protein N
VKRARLAFGLAAALLGAVEGLGANPPAPLDLPPSNVIPAPVDVTPSAAPRAERPADPTGNPLWALPLSALTATRERPIFLPSRRAPAPAVAGTPAVAPPPPPPPPPAEPEQPPLTLVGAIAGDSEGFAVFLDQATNNVVRLKTGQDHQGWVLRAVKGREATLEKNKRTATLSLPVPTAASLSEPAAAPPPPPQAPPPQTTLPSYLRPGGAALPPPRPAAPAAGPAAAKPPPRRSPSSVGAPTAPIPGDPRPLEDQL